MKNIDKESELLAEISKDIKAAKKFLTELNPDQAGTWGAWAQGMYKKVGALMTGKVLRIFERPPCTALKMTIQHCYSRGFLTKEEVQIIVNWAAQDEGVIMDVVTPHNQSELLYRQLYVNDLVDFVEGSTLEGRFDEDLDKATQDALKKLVKELPTEIELLTIGE